LFKKIGDIELEALSRICRFSQLQILSNQYTKKLAENMKVIKKLLKRLKKEIKD
jgi:hypothetical protein